MSSDNEHTAPSSNRTSPASRETSNARAYEWALWAVHHRSDGTLRECFRDHCNDDGTPESAPGSAGRDGDGEP